MTLAGYGSVNTTENDRAKGVLTTDGICLQWVMTTIATNASDRMLPAANCVLLEYAMKREKFVQVGE